jgi:hypothetical protein
MRRRVVAIGMPVLCLTACANVWGFHDLTLEPDGGADATTSDGAPVRHDGGDASPIDGPPSEGAAGTGPDADTDAEAGCDGPTNTTVNCSMCGLACDTSHSVDASCSGTTCSYEGCKQGYADCNTTAPDLNGCETQVDAAGCSVCGQTCDTMHSEGGSCVGGTCVYTGCATGWANCNKTPPNTSGCAADLNTSTSNCGGCGNACDTTTGTPSCVAAKCVYVCHGGRADCNVATAPDTDGCECATPGCCQTACETIHSNGIGQTFHDCAALGTHDQMQAQAACTAFTGNNAQCASTGTTCLLNSSLVELPQSVCGSASGKCFCWVYAGSASGVGTVKMVANISMCSAVCPTIGDKTWN